MDITIKLIVIAILFLKILYIFLYMKSKQDDGILQYYVVLHKTEFEKIIRNSPKTNFEECINPPSFS